VTKRVLAWRLDEQMSFEGEYRARQYHYKPMWTFTTGFIVRII